ncbi:MAG: hypothetical protein KDJ27_10850 [Gammaproteobacteria bacterium]|nr:hypothetical protein [Gammaproteobacteria bacterium]
MSKLYFLVPSATVTEQIVTDLQAAGYDGSSIGIIASDRHARGDLPTARATDASDVADAGKRGALAGGSAALLGGLAAAVVPGGIAVGGAVLAAAALAGTALGGAIAGALGLSAPNEEIAVFERAIEEGDLLLIIHCDEDARERVKQIVVDRHPQAAFSGEDDAIPPVV